MKNNKPTLMIPTTNILAYGGFEYKVLICEAENLYSKQLQIINKKVSEKFFSKLKSQLNIKVKNKYGK